MAHVYKFPVFKLIFFPRTPGGRPSLPLAAEIRLPGQPPRPRPLPGRARRRLRRPAHHLSHPAARGGQQPHLDAAGLAGTLHEPVAVGHG